jgi:SNF2 family DNA or RNA helicase
MGAAATVLELEDVLTTSWANAADIEAYVERFRGEPDIVPVELPDDFKGILRPYQQQGVDWLQHLASHGLGGFLADDMGLGKTAQTIANICVEHAEGRLTAPALIVVPTSLVANWTAELTKFSPHLVVVVLHGLERHEKREQLADVHVVITTYTVLTRDIEVMKHLPWHIVVLDEAQAIKSPEARATRAVCQLKTTNKICLSGTPIENNLDELWSQFAFLMPGLLGDRRGFTKRFRTPIEKNGDPECRAQLVQRISPFILRRTKQEVATELPPKHTILRRITLAPDQRELYETIRGTLYETVREQMAERTLAQSRVIVLDALLKLRQACCDPRLVKLGNARGTESSAKLDDLMEMIAELIPEGRRILVFSQFTSMLDLIKPRLNEAGVPFVELRGDTRDRATPVETFEAGKVPLFLISLKAGGRGLNLTSADTVIHYDPWWNPAVEAQASDRAHRIGQTKSVFVYKLIATDTVEERILELQQRKAELASIAFQEGGGLAFNAEDIDYLFGADRSAEAEAA